MSEEIAKDHVLTETGNEVRWVKPNTLLWKIIRIVVVFLPPIGVMQPQDFEPVFEILEKSLARTT
jgi:hypothetical protein